MTVTNAKQVIDYYSQVRFYKWFIKNHSEEEIIAKAYQLIQKDHYRTWGYIGNELKVVSW